MYDTKENYLSGEKLYRSVIGENYKDVHTLVGQLLLELGFKYNLIGTRFLKDAILRRYSMPDVARISYARDIFTHIANKYQTTLTSVVKCIHHSIVDCAQHGNLSALSSMLHARIVEPGYAPPTVELISGIVEWLELERDKGHISADARV